MDDPENKEQDNGGDTITVGDVTGSGIAIGRGASATLTNVSQTIGTMPQADEAAKAELQRLVEELKVALTKVPPEKAEEAEAVAAQTEVLVNAASTEEPNKPMLRISGQGLKQAAENLAEVTPTVLDIARKIVATVATLAAL